MFDCRIYFPQHIIGIWYGLERQPWTFLSQQICIQFGAGYATNICFNDNYRLSIIIQL
jgi:hypothetical protein